jgi:hypothetical protein
MPRRRSALRLQWPERASQAQDRDRLEAHRRRPQTHRVEALTPGPATPLDWGSASAGAAVSGRAAARIFARGYLVAISARQA